MSKLMAHNLRVFLIWTLLFTAGYCLGGLTGVGIVALILTIIQVFA